MGVLPPLGDLPLVTLLGVHKKSTNNAVRGELGRYPLLITILDYSVRFYVRLFDLNDESLVKQSCLDSSLDGNHKSWMVVMDRVKILFRNTATIRTEMQQMYKQKWEFLLNVNNPDSKLRSYSKFKKSFSVENYILRFPLYVRRNMTKLRISAHSLAIETGRFSVPNKTPIEKRNCFHCGQIEDEFHVIFNCNLYSEERSNLAITLLDFTTLTLDPSDETFCILMSCMNGDIEVGKAMCEFVNSCFAKRSVMLSLKNENEILLRPKITVTKSGRHSKRPSKFNI